MRKPVPSFHFYSQSLCLSSWCLPTLGSVLPECMIPCLVLCFCLFLSFQTPESLGGLASVVDQNLVRFLSSSQGPNRNQSHPGGGVLQCRTIYQGATYIRVNPGMSPGLVGNPGPRHQELGDYQRFQLRLEATQVNNQRSTEEEESCRSICLGRVVTFGLCTWEDSQVEGTVQEATGGFTFLFPPPATCT